ncbi:MAG: lytic transglycosylase domain-containing protein [Allorhizobium sp.]|uniref:lytic transglycosylase domain-containing protein n=1 Tax=Allorhizobium sp. TaxID=633478 RepID=UPI004033EB04
MMKRGAIISCLIGQLALSAGAHAETQSQVRRVALLDFSAPSTPVAQPTAPTDAVSNGMLLDFRDMRRSDATAPSLNTFSAISPDSYGIVRSIRVPGWMRSGQSTNHFANLALGLPTIGNCSPKAYSSSGLLGRSAEERRRLLYPLVQRAACEAGLPIGLMDAMLIQESRYNPVAVSPKGAFGLGQLMPGTAKQLGVDRYSLHGNLRGAARYLSWQLKEFGRVDLALAAYNAGPGRVRTVRRVPRITETQNYVTKILTNWRVIESNHRPLEPAQASPPPARAVWIGDFRRSAGIGGSK